MPASAAIRATCSAIFRACASLSITQGPAIRKSGFPPPRRSEPRGISRGIVIRSIEDSTWSKKSGGKPQHSGSSGGVGCGAKNGSSWRFGGGSVRRLAGCDGGGSRGARLLFLVFQGGADEGRKERVRLQRLGFEFRMKLAAEEPGMLGRLDDLDVIFVRGAYGNAQARADKRLLVITIKFVTVAVALADFKLSVSLVCEGARLEPARPRAEAHSAA